ncbi:hypothetical protein JAAARDRAFT_187969 [Jaapia argillacea MUCL 33604]|uniref:Uncharacterized protein n=1 Tax=Jaapia argillacea MUCL 33604 TaxID=933084 RepID=A0A067QCH5_9AGAM|nr:hypothetical protein JAAARDRAFT_187969 [Jaapia argillacea MUCL 33604]
MADEFEPSAHNYCYIHTQELSPTIAVHSPLDIPMTTETPLMDPGQTSLLLRYLYSPTFAERPIEDEFQSNLRDEPVPANIVQDHPRPVLTGLGILCDELLSAFPTKSADRSSPDSHLDGPLRLRDICNIDSSPAQLILTDPFLGQDLPANAPSTLDHRLPVFEPTHSTEKLADWVSQAQATSSRDTSAKRSLFEDFSRNEWHSGANFEFSSLRPNRPLIGLFPDTTVFKSFSFIQEHSACVNPADIMININSEHRDDGLEEFLYPGSSPLALVDSQMVVCPSPSADSSSASVSPLVPEVTTAMTVADQPCQNQQRRSSSPPWPLESPGLSFSAFAPSGWLPETLDPRNQHVVLSPTPHVKSEKRTPLLDITMANSLPGPSESNMDSPVLNAHLGVDLDELRRKVEVYKQRNMGSEMDTTWFYPFVGKLSTQGELLDDYRCYVTGCDQKNKRRDHIITHVGSHVDYRPFQCGFW